MKRLNANLPAGLILDHLAVGVFTVDPDFRITSFNARAEELTGFTRNEALGKRCYEIFRADMCFQGECALRRAMDSETSIVRERAAILDKRNTERPVEITADVLRDESGAIIGGVETILDDTDRALLEKQVKGSYSFDDVVGRSPAMAALFEALPVLAGSEATMLILGETGTGKGLVARAVHNASPRREGPFVKVNSAALPANLLESELFGYRKGAFTDARTDKPGMFELAEGGSIFLDEIGEMDIGLQAKLLQVLEDKEYYPLGGARPVRVDARVIASTNCDLGGMVRDGSFRPDLYYRLQVAQLDLPPLRERREDIPLLATHCLQEFRALGGPSARGLSRAAMRLLLEHEFPGNVRELRNALEYAAALKPGGIIEPRDLPRYLQQASTGANKPEPAPDTTPASEPPETEPPGARAPAPQRQALEQALQESLGSRTRAASKLGISRTTLWRRMKQAGLID
jgi:PAS domain S-box-containing protein